MTNEEYDKMQEEHRRIYEGDGELRLWRVNFKTIGIHQEYGKPMKSLEDVYEVHEAYVRVIAQFGALAAAWTDQGSPHQHTWWVWANGYREVELLVVGSPAGNHEKIHRIEVGFPYQPALVAPQLAKALRPPLRHPMLEQVLRGDFTIDEAMEHFSDDHMDDAEFFLIRYMIWGWGKRMERELPEFAADLQNPEADIWPSLSKFSASWNAEVRAIAAMEQSGRELRNTEGRLAEFGVDVAELRRQAEEYSSRGEPLPPDFWYSIPMKEPIRFEGDPLDDEEELDEEEEKEDKEDEM